MSNITDIIIVTLYEGVTTIQSYLREHCNGAGLVEASRHTEGVKSTGICPPSPRPMQCHVYIGAVNGLDEEAFISAIENRLVLDHPHCFQLFLKREDDDKFSEVKIQF